MIRGKINTVIEHRRLSVRDNLIAYLPLIISIFLWAYITFLPLKYFKSVSNDPIIISVLLMVWLLVSLKLAHLIIIKPVTAWEVLVEKEVSK